MHVFSYFFNSSLQVFLHQLVLMNFKTSFIESGHFNIETCELVRDGEARHTHCDDSVLKMGHGSVFLFLEIRA